ncbi:MAG: hypothetical protein R2860_14210 [Desulfobacterales bacterium]
MVRHRRHSEKNPAGADTAEGIVAVDEGMGGWFVAKNVKGPGKRYIRRREGFVGCLVVTRKRIVCYTFGNARCTFAWMILQWPDLWRGSFRKRHPGRVL